MAAILSADPSVTSEQKKGALTVLSTEGKQTVMSVSRIIRREEAAQLLGVGVKRIDQLSRAGILKRITVPGTSRAIGLSEASVRALTEGSAD